MRDSKKDPGEPCETLGGDEEPIWANYNDVSRRVVTLNGGLIRELPQNPQTIQV